MFYICKLLFLRYIIRLIYLKKNLQSLCIKNEVNEAYYCFFINYQKTELLTFAGNCENITGSIIPVGGFR